MKMKKRFVFGAMFSLVLLLLAGCNTNVTPSTTPPPTSNELNLSYWSEYLPLSVLEQFEQEYGIKVNYIGYESGAAAIDEIRNGKSYDLIILSFDEVPVVLSANLAQTLDYGNIPNAANISPAYRDLSFDPGGRYTIPYDWGTMGILVRTDRVNMPIASWQDFWSEEIGGKVAMWNHYRYAMSPALMRAGYSINATNPAEIEAACQALLQLSDRTVLIPSEEPNVVPYLQQDGVVAGVGFAYDALYAQQEGLPIEYVLPSDGVIVWGESMLVPTTAQNKYAAELFINFMLRPEISAQTTNEFYYATAVQGTDAYITPELLGNPIIFPSQESLANSDLEMALNESTFQLYTDCLNRWVSSIK